MSRPLLDFDDAGAPDDDPAKGVTVGDIRRWFDEIERLEAENADLILRARALDTHASGLEAEIERLTRLLDAFHDGAEIERLRLDFEHGMERFYSQGAELDNARTKIERLRALLHEAWAVLPSCPFRERVRAALEQKP